MGQKEILEFLARNPNKWFSGNQISDKMNVSLQSILTNLRNLRSTNFVEWKAIKKRVVEYRYKHKEVENEEY